jgi:hypothetical protein
MYTGLHVKCPLFLSDSYETWIFSTDFLKILKYQISLKSVEWNSNCSMQTDGRTDRHDEASSRFSQFCEKRLITEVESVYSAVRTESLRFVFKGLITFRSNILNYTQAVHDETRAYKGVEHVDLGVWSILIFSTSFSVGNKKHSITAHCLSINRSTSRCSQVQGGLQQQPSGTESTVNEHLPL